MGWRQRVVNVLSRGAAPAVNADDIVEAGVVPLAMGPLVLEALRAEGIAADGVQSFDDGMQVRSRVRIMVRGDDLPEAREIVAQHL